MTYRVGWPFWKQAFKLGVKLSYRYQIFYDVDCKRYIGISPDVTGLIAECDTPEEVKSVIEGNAPDLVSCQIYGSKHSKSLPSDLLVPNSHFAKGLIHG